MRLHIKIDPAPARKQRTKIIFACFVFKAFERTIFHVMNIYYSWYMLDLLFAGSVYSHVRCTRGFEMILKNRGREWSNGISIRDS